ncbi:MULTISPECIES: hypothetical protein [unclassified Microbulbifer]|uniref:hypothetical protein n=1 Tax=unclassified Microbulbifer TaxID=2619833 RepID=UPI0027E3E580|nr:MULTISPECIES: hypothetical protein [unclassified Microbulbifer]
MNFSDKEIQLIKKAERSVKQAVVMRIIAIFVSLLLIALFFLGEIGPEMLAVSAFGLAVFTILAPQIGGAPKYEKLALLLVSKLKSQEHT